MRIFADNLAEQLNKQLHPIYLLLGNEPLLIEESRSAIYRAAHLEGFTEKQRFSLEKSAHWEDIYNSVQAMSLFSSRKIIELELPNSGVNNAITKELAALFPLLHPDIILVVIGSKITKAQENAKWFKQLSDTACRVNCLTPDIIRLPQFIRARCKLRNLTPDDEALQMLSQWYEGNLLALNQSLEKLTLLYPDGELNLVRLEKALSRSNHYTIYHWCDALLAGKMKRSQRILRQLKAEGIEPVIITRALQKELTQLFAMATNLKLHNLHQIFEQHRVWQSKRPLYTAALGRLSTTKIQHLLQLLCKIEITTKTQYEQSSWPLLQQLGIEACMPQVKF